MVEVVMVLNSKKQYFGIIRKQNGFLSYELCIHKAYMKICKIVKIIKRLKGSKLMVLLGNYFLAFLDQLNETEYSDMTTRKDYQIPNMNGL